MKSASLLALVEREQSKRAAGASLYEFVKQSWHVVEPSVPFVPSWHIEEICEHLQAVSSGDIRRLLINIPPRHSKSTIASVMWPAWEWIAEPEQKFLCASYSSVLSIRDNLKTRRLITSPWYQERWGDRFELAGDQNAKQRFENDRTGYRIATSVGGSATGEGGSRLIIDDPHGAQDAQSDALRSSAIEWFDMVWSTRLNDPKKDAMVTIMQRLHQKDLSGHILEDIGGWEHIRIPAEWDGERRRTILGPYDPRKIKGELICPDRFGPVELATLKKALGVYGSSGQLQQDPAPAVGGILDTSYFKLWPADQRRPPLEFVLQSYDTAFTELATGQVKAKAKPDPSTCTVYGIFTLKGIKQAMLLDAWDEYLSYPQLRKRAVDDYRAEYGADQSPKSGMPTKGRRPDRVLVEQKASGQSLIQDLRLAKVPIIGYNPGNADKVSRAHVAAPILELGVIWIPESAKNQGKPVTWAEPFLSQLSKFPVAEHDDYVDTFTQAMIYFKNDGWLELPKAKQIDDDRPPRGVVENPYAA